VNLAGLLAEMGVGRAVLEFGVERREVRARQTDLPREIVEMGEGAVVAGRVRFLVSAAAIVRV
jgi:hypothetical protein